MVEHDDVRQFSLPPLPRVAAQGPRLKSSGASFPVSSGPCALRGGRGESDAGVRSVRHAFSVNAISVANSSNYSTHEVSDEESEDQSLNILSACLLELKHKYLGDMGSSIFPTKKQEGQALFSFALVMFFIFIKSFAGSLSPVILAGMLFLASRNFKGMVPQLGLGLGKQDEKEVYHPQAIELDEYGNRMNSRRESSTLDDVMDELHGAHDPSHRRRAKETKQGIAMMMGRDGPLADDFQHHRKVTVVPISGYCDDEVPGKVGKGAAARIRRDRKRRTMQVQVKEKSGALNMDNVTIW